MTKFNTEVRLTDSLERELMAQAIAEEMRIKPIKALTSFFAKIAEKLNRREQNISADTAQTQS